MMAEMAESRASGKECPWLLLISTTGGIPGTKAAAVPSRQPRRTST